MPQMWLSAPITVRATPIRPNFSTVSREAALLGSGVAASAPGDAAGSPRAADHSTAWHTIASRYRTADVVIAMVDDASEEVTVGECVTWLNDAVLMAPSMLLTPAVAWADAGDGAFEFQRTVSRLMEMQSSDYLAACRNRHPDQLPTTFAPFALTNDLT